jgi:hypothetical protein
MTECPNCIPNWPANDSQWDAPDLALPHSQLAAPPSPAVITREQACNHRERFDGIARAFVDTQGGEEALNPVRPANEASRE